VWATDRSSAALEVARGNARHLGLPQIQFAQGDWYSAFLSGYAPLTRPTPRGSARFDAIACNPPYVAPNDPHWHGLEFEPRQALEASDDGLAALTAVIQSAPAHLQPGGWLVLEHGAEQATAVAEMFQTASFAAIALHDDLAGLPRVTEGQFQ
jgi:release factor glutamine methyltransferase